MKLPLLWLAGWGAGLPAKQSHAPEAATRQPDSAAVLRALESLPYRHFTTAGDRVLAEWQRLRGLGKGWPVVVGDDEALVELADSYAANAPRTAREILAAARTERLSRGAKTGIDLNDRKQTGDWPATASVEPGLSVARDVLSDKPFPKVHILLLPLRTVPKSRPIYVGATGTNVRSPSATSSFCAIGANATARNWSASAET